ncbi:MAG: hypothetical protein JNM59_14515 [Hyphomonadaceae bacterium]|nr:hypothetical protein [Hyphomonadaceae bacterium]
MDCGDACRCETYYLPEVWLDQSRASRNGQQHERPDSAPHVDTSTYTDAELQRIADGEPTRWGLGVRSTEDFLENGLVLALAKRLQWGAFRGQMVMLWPYWLAPFALGAVMVGIGWIRRGFSRR